MRGFGIRTWDRLALLALALVLVASACNGSTEETGGGGETDQSGLPDIEYAEQQIADWEGHPDWEAPGPAFDASAAAGKSVFAIPTVSQVPFVQAFMDAQKEVAELVGLDYRTCENNGTVSEWAKCMNAGLGQKPDLIMLSAPDPAELQPQIQEANDAGIPVLSTGLYDPAIPKVDGITAWTFWPYQIAARLEADWIIKQSNGEAHVLVITAGDLITSQYITEAIEDEFDTVCGDGCTTTTIDVPVPEWGTKLQTAAQTALISDPDINYVLPIYDGMSQLVEPAINQANRQDLRIVTFNGSPFALDMLRDGDVIEMDVGQDLLCIGYSNMDPVLRLLAGEEPVDNTNQALRVWTDENVDEAGVPAEMSQGYGDDCTGGFKELWGLA